MLQYQSEAVSRKEGAVDSGDVHGQDHPQSLTGLTIVLDEVASDCRAREQEALETWQEHLMFLGGS